MQMAQMKNEEACLLFLDYEGFDILAVNSHGENILHKAAQSGLPKYEISVIRICIDRFSSVLRCLLSLNKFDINAKTNSGDTALLLVCRTSCKEYGQLECIELLLKQKEIDANIKDSAGVEALQHYLQNCSHLERLGRLGAGAIHKRILGKAKKFGVTTTPTTGKRKGKKLIAKFNF